MVSIWGFTYTGKHWHFIIICSFVPVATSIQGLVIIKVLLNGMLLLSSALIGLFFCIAVPFILYLPCLLQANLMYITALLHITPPMICRAVDTIYAPCVHASLKYGT